MICSICNKIWALDTGRGVCKWCNKPAVAINTISKPRLVKSNGKHGQRQSVKKPNDYEGLTGNWLAYYRIASRFSHKAKPEDREDIVHDIIEV